MHIVGIRKDTGKVLLSQTFEEDSKDAITEAIYQAAESAGIEITTSEMTDEELQTAISNSVD